MHRRRVYWRIPAIVASLAFPLLLMTSCGGDSGPGTVTESSMGGCVLGVKEVYCREQAVLSKMKVK